LTADESAVGSLGRVLDKARFVRLVFTRAGSTSRDTTLSTMPRNGEARVRLSLAAGEQIAGLLVAAELDVGAGVLFAGQRVVRVEPGTPTSAEIPISPVPDRIRAMGGTSTFQRSAIRSA
jgi:hypothetical protein